jgi:hypothetical protein
MAVSFAKTKEKNRDSEWNAKRAPQSGSRAAKPYRSQHAKPVISCHQSKRGGHKYSLDAIAVEQAPSRVAAMHSAGRGMPSTAFDCATDVS